MVKSEIQRFKILIAALLSVSFIISGCGNISSTSEPESSIDELSKHYQQDHDYRSLVLLLPQLNPMKMRRSDVEELLGQPAYCPGIDQCYYDTDVTIPAMCGEGTKLQENGNCLTVESGKEFPPLNFPLTLVVSYIASDEEALSSDRFIGFWLGLVGE